MKKAELFATIKEVNKIVDAMAGMDTKSAKYTELSDALYWSLEALFFDKNKYYTINLSQRTGHYYVTF